MADKYAHLRPRLPRSCHRRDRTPKVRMTEERARATAARWPGYHAYQCPHCGWWHTGQDSDPEAET